MSQLFYVASFIAIISVIMAVTRRHPVHALLYLIISLLSVSVILFIYGAPLLAALEIIIYAGAILVLFIFVMMMLNIEYKDKPQFNSRRKMWVVPFILVLILTAEIIYSFTSAENYIVEREVVPSQEIGKSLFGKYMIAVHLAAMMMLAGIVGAYHLGKTKPKALHRFMKINKV